MHDEDILSMSIYSNKSLPAIVVASASYDGDIYIWSLETGSVLSKLNRIESFSTQTRVTANFSKIYSQQRPSSFWLKFNSYAWGMNTYVRLRDGSQEPFSILPF